MLGGRVGVSETACGRGGKLDPSPYPLPWAWTGPVARGWSVQDGPGWLQEGLREPKMASKMAQDTPRSLKMAPNMLQEVSRSLQDGSKWARSLPNRPPRRPNPSKTMVLAFSPVRFRWLSEASRWLQEGPRGAPDGPKSAPRGPQEATLGAQEGRQKLRLPPLGLTKH